MDTSITTIQSQLPGPDDRPEADWVIYDGKCIFCTRQVARLNRFDGGNRLAFLSLHDPRVANRCSELSHEDLMQQMYVATTSGQTFGGAAAIRYLTRRLPRLWVAAPLLHIPFTLPLWQWMYTKVAERRYRISGRVEECEPGSTCDLHFGKKQD